MIADYPAGFELPRAVSAASWRVLMRGLVEGRSGGSQYPMRTPVIGYLRSSVPDRAALDLSGELLTDYAADHDLDVIGMYRDDGVSDTSTDRPAFAALLAALEASKATAVLVPPAHLSSDPDVRAALLARIQDTGAAVYFLES